MGSILISNIDQLEHIEFQNHRAAVNTNKHLHTT